MNCAQPARMRCTQGNAPSCPRARYRGGAGTGGRERCAPSAAPGSRPHAGRGQYKRSPHQADDAEHPPKSGGLAPTLRALLATHRPDALVDRRRWSERRGTLLHFTQQTFNLGDNAVFQVGHPEVQRNPGPLWRPVPQLRGSVRSFRVRSCTNGRTWPPDLPRRGQDLVHRAIPSCRRRLSASSPTELIGPIRTQPVLRATAGRSRVFRHGPAYRIHTLLLAATALRGRLRLSE